MFFVSLFLIFHHKVLFTHIFFFFVDIPILLRTRMIFLFGSRLRICLSTVGDLEPSGSRASKTSKTTSEDATTFLNSLKKAFLDESKKNLVVLFFFWYFFRWVWKFSFSLFWSCFFCYLFDWNLQGLEFVMLLVPQIALFWNQHFVEELQIVLPLFSFFCWIFLSLRSEWSNARLLKESNLFLLLDGIFLPLHHLLQHLLFLRPQVRHPRLFVQPCTSQKLSKRKFDIRFRISGFLLLSFLSFLLCSVIFFWILYLSLKVCLLLLSSRWWWVEKLIWRGMEIWWERTLSNHSDRFW